MATVEDRVAKVEKDIEYIKEDMRETKAEIKAINTIYTEFSLKMERLVYSLDENAKSINQLNDYMQKQMTKGNMAFSKIGWMIITACVSGGIGLLFALFK